MGLLTKFLMCWIALIHAIVKCIVGYGIAILALIGLILLCIIHPIIGLCVTALVVTMLIAWSTMD
jgi:hypothetical protein